MRRYKATLDGWQFDCLGVYQNAATIKGPPPRHPWLMNRKRQIERSCTSHRRRVQTSRHRDFPSRGVPSIGPLFRCPQPTQRLNLTVVSMEHRRARVIENGKTRLSCIPPKCALNSTQYMSPMESGKAPCHLDGLSDQLNSQYSLSPRGDQEFCMLPDHPCMSAALQGWM